MRTSKPRVGYSADGPAPKLPTQEKRAISSDKKQEGANPPQRRHRMAGSTSSGEYVTEHHRGRSKG